MNVRTVRHARGRGIAGARATSPVTFFLMWPKKARADRACPALRSVNALYTAALQLQERRSAIALRPGSARRHVAASRRIAPLEKEMK